MIFRSAKIKSVVVFSFVCALLLVNCTAKPKTTSDQLIGKWEMVMLGDEKIPGTKKATFTYRPDRSCKYELFENGESEKEEICYYLLLNNETVLATYYDEQFVELQEQFDIVKINARELVLEERKSNGKTVMLARSGE